MDAADGFTLTGGVIPAGLDQVRVTLTVPPVVMKAPVTIGLEGKATVQGRHVAHRAVPADDMMQAFLYRHLVPTDGLYVSVIARGATRAMVRVLAPQPVKLPVNGTARVRVAIPLPRACPCGT
jgi:hypothetical protein